MLISNPKPDLHNINAHTNDGENPLIFTKVKIRKCKHGRVAGRQLCQKIDDICLLAVPNQISSISILRAKVVTIHSSYCPETKIRTDGCTTDEWADGQTGGHMDNQRDTIVTCPYRATGYKKKGTENVTSKRTQVTFTFVTIANSAFLFLLSRYDFCFAFIDFLFLIVVNTLSKAATVKLFATSFIEQMLFHLLE